VLVESLPSSQRFSKSKALQPRPASGSLVVVEPAGRLNVRNFSDQGVLSTGGGVED
jgi:hypothetical protein